MNHLSPVAAAVLPVIIFIAIGYFLRRNEFLPDNGWDAVEKVVYYIGLPCLIIRELSVADIRADNFFDIAVSLVVAQLIMFAVSFFSWCHKDINGPRFTGIVQNNIRWNTYVALGLTTNYLGADKVPLLAAAIAAMTPVANIVGVWTMLIWGKPEKEDYGAFTGLFANPLIIACAVGGLMQYLDLKPVGVIDDTLKMLGDSAMPIGLIAAGAGINFTNMQDTTHERLLWSAIRLFGLPAAALFSCYIFGVHDKNILIVSVIAAASPTATSAYILARQMGGDASFTASLIGASSLFSVITTPLILILTLNYFI